MKKTKKKFIVAVVCVIVLWFVIGIVDFALVHNYRKPLFCIGVDLADDGGSGRYVGLGYSFDIEGNFMPDTETPATEDKKPKVTSHRGYIFGKEVSRGFWDEMLPTPYKSMDDVIEKDGETNISKDLIGTPYAEVEGGIALLYKNEWYLCSPVEEATDE